MNPRWIIIYHGYLLKIRTHNVTKEGFQKLKKRKKEKRKKG